MRIPKGVRVKLPGDIAGGLYIFTILFAIALIELYIIRKAYFSISGRSQFYGFTVGGQSPQFVGLPEEMMQSGAPMMCEQAEGIWQPLDPNEPMNGIGCCAEAMDPMMLEEAEIPLCDDFAEMEEDYGEPAEMEDYGDDDDEDEDEGRGGGGGRGRGGKGGRGRGGRGRDGRGGGRRGGGYGKGDSDVSVSGSGACACANGKCTGDCAGGRGGKGGKGGKRGKGGSKGGKGATGGGGRGMEKDEDEDEDEDEDDEQETASIAMVVIA